MKGKDSVCLINTGNYFDSYFDSEIGFNLIFPSCTFSNKVMTSNDQVTKYVSRDWFPTLA